MDNIRFGITNICDHLGGFNKSLLMSRYLVCLAIFSLAVDLARQVANKKN